VFSKIRAVGSNNPASCSNYKPDIGHPDKSILILHKSSSYCTTGYRSFLLGRYQLTMKLTSKPRRLTQR